LEILPARGVGCAHRGVNESKQAITIAAKAFKLFSGHLGAAHASVGCAVSTVKRGREGAREGL